MQLLVPVGVDKIIIADHRELAEWWQVRGISQIIVFHSRPDNSGNRCNMVKPYLGVGHPPIFIGGSYTVISIKASHDCGMTMPQASDVVGLSVWSRGRLSHWIWLGFAWEIGPSPRPKSKNTSPQNHPKPRLSTICKGLALDVCDHYQLFISSFYYCIKSLRRRDCGQHPTEVKALWPQTTSPQAMGGEMWDVWCVNWIGPHYGRSSLWNIPVTLWLCQNSYWKWLFIVDFPIKNGDFQ